MSSPMCFWCVFFLFLPLMCRNAIIEVFSVFLDLDHVVGRRGLFPLFYNACVEFSSHRNLFATFFLALNILTPSSHPQIKLICAPLIYSINSFLMCYSFVGCGALTFSDPKPFLINMTWWCSVNFHWSFCSLSSVE